MSPLVAKRQRKPNDLTLPDSLLVEGDIETATSSSLLAENDDRDSASTVDETVRFKLDTGKEVGF